MYLYVASFCMMALFCNCNGNVFALFNGFRDNMIWWPHYLIVMMKCLFCMTSFSAWWHLMYLLYISSDFDDIVLFSRTTRWWGCGWETFGLRSTVFCLYRLAMTCPPSPTWPLRYSSMSSPHPFQHPLPHPTPTPTPPNHLPNDTSGTVLLSNPHPMETCPSSPTWCFR